MADDKVRMCSYPACGRKGKQVKSYRIDVDQGFLTADLCREHAAPVTELIADLPSHLFTKVVRDHNRSRSTSFQVTTLEEIERKKRPRGR